MFDLESRYLTKLVMLAILLSRLVMRSSVCLNRRALRLKDVVPEFVSGALVNRVVRRCSSSTRLARRNCTATKASVKYIACFKMLCKYAKSIAFAASSLFEAVSNVRFESDQLYHHSIVSVMSTAPSRPIETRLQDSKPSYP